MPTMASSQEVEDRLAIRELIELYSLSVTLRDWEAVGSCFHPAARWHTNVGHDFHTRQGVQDGIRASAEAMEFLVQMSHGVVIRELTPERATANVVLNEIGSFIGRDAGVFVLGVYYDTLVKHEGRWVFLERNFQAHYIDPAKPRGRQFVDYATLPGREAPPE
jgi:hypothetical protein